MTNITVKIEAAPELIAAIEKFAEAFCLRQYRLLEQLDPAPETTNITEGTQAVQPASVAPVQATAVTPVPVQSDTPSALAPAPAAVPASVPTQEQTYTAEQLAIAGTQVVDAGKMNELQALLAEFGVQALTQLPKEHYGNFATRLRALGAKI